MWVVLIAQGALGCAVLIWFAVQNWPSQVSSLLALPFPVLFVVAGWMIHQRERKVEPMRAAYLDSNEAARRRLGQARRIKWVAIAGALVAVVLLASLMPRNWDGDRTLTWIVAAVFMAAIAIPVAYSSLVQSQIEDAATRESEGKPLRTPAEQRKLTIWTFGLLVLVLAIIAFDEFVETPVSAMFVFIWGCLLFAAVAFIWRKLNPPRDGR